jgi:predicted DNA-binding helix-hairpin-helix protein
LYQSSFLIRDYGFSLEDMPFDECGNLPKNTDPKLAWAKKHLTDHPIELNRATYKQLLQIPGIGPKGAAQIIKTRRERALKDLSELSKLGIITKRAATFILLNGKRPNQQLLLF